MLPGSHTSPAARFRIWQFCEPLRQLGHEIVVRVIRPERDWTPAPGVTKPIVQRLGAISHVATGLNAIRDADEFDVVFMNRDVIPEASVEFVEQRLLNRTRRVVFDFDDAIHLGTRRAKLTRLLPRVAAVTPGNEFLATFARPLNGKTEIIPTVVDTALYLPAESRPEGPLRIGWSGSRSTLKQCLPILRPVMTELSRRIDCEFLVIADVPPDEYWAGVRMRFVQWSPSDEVINLQQFDIGLMPLRDDDFERGKCGLKAIQYMGVGVPALVSPVGVNREIVMDGETGFHCESHEDWMGQMMTLATDPSLRASIGSAGRTRAVQHYSVNAVLPRLLSVLHDASELR
jgi:glycosyltransferase involved in cell wall biosynthesis